jgi:hypothetical protein
MTGCAATMCDTLCKPKIYPQVKSAQFNTSEFENQKDINISYWVTKTDDKVLIIQPNDNFYTLIEEVKTLKYNYNLLLDSINKFNIELN